MDTKVLKWAVYGPFGNLWLFARPHGLLSVMGGFLRVEVCSLRYSTAKAALYFSQDQPRVAGGPSVIELVAAWT